METIINEIIKKEINWEIVRAINVARILFSGKRYKADMIRNKLKRSDKIFTKTDVIASFKILINPKRY